MFERKVRISPETLKSFLLLSLIQINDIKYALENINNEIEIKINNIDYVTKINFNFLELIFQFDKIDLKIKKINFVEHELLEFDVLTSDIPYNCDMITLSYHILLDKGKFSPSVFKTYIDSNGNAIV